MNSTGLSPSPVHEVAPGLELLQAAGVAAFADSPLTELELAEHEYLREGDFE